MFSFNNNNNNNYQSASNMNSYIYMNSFYGLKCQLIYK